jgi:ribonuclease P protein component
VAAGSGGGRRERLSYSQRLHDPSDFQRVYAAQKSVKAPNVIVCFCPNGLPIPRLGVSVGKKFGNAVVRNRIKRVFRAAFRQSQHLLPPGFDYVLIPRHGVPEYRARDVLESLSGAASRIGKTDFTTKNTRNQKSTKSE